MSLLQRTALFLVLPLSLTLAAPGFAPVPLQQGCSGCFGTGATAAASNGSGQGRVKITLTVESGACSWSFTEDPLLMACKPVVGCATSVFREWSGLPSGTTIDFCVEVDEEEYCLKKVNVVDSDGAGNSTRIGPVLPCSAEAAEQHSFKVRSDAVGIEAEATGQCSPCRGNP